MLNTCLSFNEIILFLDDIGKTSDIKGFIFMANNVDEGFTTEFIIHISLCCEF